MTCALVGLCGLLTYPFLPALTWGIALAILAWPMHRAIVRRVSSRNLAAALSTTAVVAVILVPCLFVGYQVTREAAAAAEQASQEGSAVSIREKAAEVPGVSGVVAWMERAGIDVETRVREQLRTYTWDFSGLAAGTVLHLVSIVPVIVLGLLFMWQDGLTLGSLKQMRTATGEDARP